MKSDPSTTPQRSFWLLFAAMAAVLWGLNYVMEQKLLQTFTVMEMLFFSSFFMTLLVGGTCVYLKCLPTPAVLKNTSRLWLVLMLVSHVGAIYLILLSIKLAASHQAAIVEITYPLFTVLFGWLFFRVRIHWSFFVGGGLILAGSWLIIAA
mgnify:CR=1 FL=1